MKVNLISDLHVDKGKFDADFCKDCDLIIIPGDVASISQSHLIVELFDKIPKEIPVLYVLGNHEYISSAYNRTEDDMKALCENYPNIQVVNNEVIILDDCRFICSTLWSDFLGNGPENYDYNKSRMDTLFPIEESFLLDDAGNRTRAGVKWIEAEAIKAQKFIEQELSKEFDGKTIVVTHFAPFLSSREDEFKHTNFTAFWTNSLERFQNYSIDYWFHGHVHQSKDYVENGIRVVTNPRGNMKKTFNTQFNPHLIIKI